MTGGSFGHVASLQRIVPERQLPVSRLRLFPSYDCVSRASATPILWLKSLRVSRGRIVAEIYQQVIIMLIRLSR